MDEYGLLGKIESLSIGDVNVIPSEENKESVLQCIKSSEKAVSSGLKKFKKMVSDKNISEEEINCSTQIFKVFEKIESLLDIYESYLEEGYFLTEKNQIVGRVIISSSASKCIGEAIHEACSLSKGLKKLSESNQLSFNGVREYIDNLGK